VSISEIEQALSQGQQNVNGCIVKIRDNQGRYEALIFAPTFNTVITTPKTISPEGLTSFYSRVAVWIALRQHPTPSP
jgi:hypothetical protein